MVIFNTFCYLSLHIDDVFYPNGRIWMGIYIFAVIYICVYEGFQNIGRAGYAGSVIWFLFIGLKFCVTNKFTVL